MDEGGLKEITKKLVAPTKGILAADWSEKSATKHFEKYGIPSNEETRRVYRQLLFTTPDIEEFISGVIFHDETIRQTTDDGTPFPKLLESKGIIPGIKVDKGTVPLANFPGEELTQGLDGLREKLLEYHGLGARFTKWRAVITIGEIEEGMLPSKTAMEANAELLALYAAMSQECDLVPIVEPEVTLEGNYDMQRNKEVTEATLKIVFERLFEHRILFDGMILKPNMVQPGKEYERKPNPEEIAAATLDVMKDAVPPEVPGIAFLSGGQSPEAATANLNAMNKMGTHPWQVTFSYARALQQPVLEVWRGDSANNKISQDTFYHRASLNSLARQGKYEEGMEK